MKYLPTDYQSFIAISRYARWLEDENRRETWAETVDRYVENIVIPVISDPKTIKDIREAILNLEVCPSMRSLMTAGKASLRDNTCMYNCSYGPIDHPHTFDEAMFILLCGTGVGFSVEHQYVDQLPEVPSLNDSDTIISVKDSKEGWAKAFRQLLALLWAGEIPKWDVSKVRPSGSRLKTFGGRASGPGPLVELFDFTIATFQQAQGRKLTSIQAHDIMCKVGEVVVVGGVRRSALISLSNLSDDDMRYAKTGEWWKTNNQRGLANNSVAYSSKPDSIQFLREWMALVESGCGERGIFNRQASQHQAAKNGRRDPSYEFGTNPCSEIILRGPKIHPENGTPIKGTGGQFCNLSEVVVRATDTEETLTEKVRLATIIGTVQATYTHFPYLRKAWKTNTEEERLLGVSLTGIMDNKLTTTDNKDLPNLLERLKAVSVDTNKKLAKKLDIPQSTAITCVKPSGTVSQLVDSASGIHVRHSPYYIRTVRADKKDPLTEFMVAKGVPAEDCARQPKTTTVFSFPQKAPKGAICTKDITAIEQLETWLAYQRHWCEHKPSVTVNVRSSEWVAVGNFVYENFDEMSGVSFLPYDEHTYQQAPYQDCSENDYKDLLKKMPKNIDWEELSQFEVEDSTIGSQELACSGDSCEIVDI
jgi:ribonucleoside-diphosphate reductase alpha chain